MSDESSDTDPLSDPLQGVEEEVVAAYLKGVEEAIEVVSVPDHSELPKLDGFFEYKNGVKAMVGEDWNTDPQWWNEQVIRDWETIQERVKLQMQTAANRQMGADVEDIDSAYTVDRVGSLRLVSYEQFILESNAGQFREERFYCDKGRRWMAKVRELFASYGYNHVRKVEVEDMVLLEVSKNPMGEI